ncbi:MAG: glycosyltransferase family 4 protein [Prevotella sp.]|nr:glycosyltransferase family 4 protein [Prevotella sp.]
MKIAILTSGILPVPAVQGGAVENLMDFFLAYNEKHRQHDITVYSVYHPDVERHEALKSKVNHYEYVDVHHPWHKVKAKIFSWFHHDGCYYYTLEYFFEQAYRRLRRQHFDVIVLENRPGYAVKLSQRLSTPVVSHIHTNLLHEATRQNLSILKSTRLFLTVSNYIKQEIAGMGQPADIEVVYNGLDSDRFNPSAVVPADRSRLGFQPEDFVAVFCGRLIPEKGIEELLQAFLQLSDRQHMKLMVIGSSDFANGAQSNAFIEHLHAMVGQLGDRVVFTGFVPYDDIPRYLAAADVAVVPSRINEAFGMTCIEACAMGLPVIATNDGGIPETLVGQRHILIDKQGDLVQQIADGLLQIASHSDLYRGNSLSPQFTKDTYAASFFKAIARHLNAGGQSSSTV